MAENPPNPSFQMIGDASAPVCVDGVCAVPTPHDDPIDQTTTEQTAPGAPSPVPSLPNLRDLGGYLGHDGRRVASGVLYRSTDFRFLDDDDIPAFADLGIATVYDLRSAAERTELPDPDMPAVTDVHLDVLADLASAIPANLGKIFTDPSSVAQASAALSDGSIAAHVAQTYREMITLPSAVSAYRRFYQGILGDHLGPALVHCTTGKDRTGWASASLLTLLGVSRDDVFDDYLLTNQRLLPALRPLFDRFAEAGGDPDSLLPVLGVDPAYLESSFDEVDVHFGNIEGYFVDGLGLGDDALEQLRAKYLVAAA